jgi:hypothetical protein
MLISTVQNNNLHTSPEHVQNFCFEHTVLDYLQNNVEVKKAQAPFDDIQQFNISLGGLWPDQQREPSAIAGCLSS